MKKYFACICVCFFFLLVPVKPGYSQIPILDIIREGITKVIVAVDLKIQRLQNETIWLQNAQKVLENEMSQLKLDEISDWVTRQRELYALYFDELRRVKTALSYYHKIKEIFAQQVQMVKEYKAAWALFQQDKNFTAGELQYMYRVYSGIFGESVKNINSESVDPVIRIRGLVKSFGSNHVLRGVDLEVRQGENVAVLGRSGTGKSVLIKIIAGLLKPDTGTVNVLGENVAELDYKDLEKLRLHIGFSFQNSALYDSMTVRENLEFPLLRNGSNL